MRNKQKQLWADEEFVRALERIRAKRVIAGMPVKNNAELTREMINSDSFKMVEDELTKIEKMNFNMKLKIRMDGKLL